MTVFAPSELQTLIMALVVLLGGQWLCNRVLWLKRLDIPPPVVGALGCMIIVGLVYRFAGLEIQFATGLRDILLLVFFTTIGLSARFSELKAGGKPLAVICISTVLLLVVQNFAGIFLALALGEHAFTGLLAGSISFVGGPGTALAWAKEGTRQGLANAPEVALAAATVAVTFGALAAGPLTNWLIRRRRLVCPATPSRRMKIIPPSESRGIEFEKIIITILGITGCVQAGHYINHLAGKAGLLFPEFLTAMIAGVLVSIFADLTKLKLDLRPVERGGELALNIFLSISLMGLRMWMVAGTLAKMLVLGIAQIILSAAVAFYVLFPWMGRSYDAAVTVGGFLGYGLSSMPVAMATMDQVTEHHGPSPKAILWITLAGAFFVDLANALLIKAFLYLPFFKP